MPTDLLRFLRDSGLTVVLATSGKPEHVDHYLDLLDGRELARTWVTAEDAEESKPAPDIVRLALEQVDAPTAVMVGDTPWDVKAASALDVPTVCVRTGGFADCELYDAGAVAVLDDLPTLQAEWSRVTGS